MSTIIEPQYSIQSRTFHIVMSETIPKPQFVSTAFIDIRSDPFPELSPTDFQILLENPSSSGVDGVLVIDARFEYEYTGGHVRDALNVRSGAQMELVYFQFMQCNFAVVFHCELSHDRAPALMAAFRQYDRMVHIDQYPALAYPHIFLLQGGYRRFYAELPQLCVDGYVPMRSPPFVENGQLRKSHSAYLLGSDRSLRRTKSQSDVDDAVPFDAEFSFARSESAPVSQRPNPK
jgi:rhodanese-related sulfurtransferase